MDNWKLDEITRYGKNLYIGYHYFHKIDIMHEMSFIMTPFRQTSLSEELNSEYFGIKNLWERMRNATIGAANLDQHPTRCLITNNGYEWLLIGFP